MARIFISYRRRDSGYLADTLYNRLQEHFGPDSVFFDVDTIPLGVDFVEFIGNAVGKCEILLAIIGDLWLGSVDDRGNRRLDDPSDFVRIEIESALKRDILVIPILAGEAEMPKANDLPPSLQRVVRRNAAELRSGRHLHQQIDRLIEGLEAVDSMKSSLGQSDLPPSRG